jgi:hypothetical protein
MNEKKRPPLGIPVWAWLVALAVLASNLYSQVLN